MSGRWARTDRPHVGPAHPPTLVGPRWAAYVTLLTAGVLLFGATPSPDAAPVGPPTTHQHVVQTTRVLPDPRWVPRKRQLSAPALPTPKLGAHRHTKVTQAPADGHHHVRTRVSPRQLSLAKW